MTDHDARAREVADAFARIVNPPPGNDRTTMWRWGEFRIENHASTVTLSMDAAKLLTTALRTAYAAGVEDAAKAGWNACRKSIYAVCEDAASEGDGHRSDTDNAPRHHFGRGFMAAAKSIARGFNSMEAEHDGNFRAAIRALIPAKESPEENADWPARAIIDGDCISIRVPISALPVAFENIPPHHGLRDAEGDPLFYVSNAQEFAQSVCRRLNAESEDGTTEIHLMLDRAMVEAVEQGDEGVEEFPAIPREED